MKHYTQTIIQKRFCLKTHFLFFSYNQSKNIVDNQVNFHNIKGKDFKSPSPLNQCCKNREREKIKNCTCFDNQQHWLKGEGICPTILLSDCNFFFVASHLEIHPAVHLNTSKAWRYCSQKEKFIKSFVILMF